jgi:hypothetical protein
MPQIQRQLLALVENGFDVQEVDSKRGPIRKRSRRLAVDRDFLFRVVWVVH